MQRTNELIPLETIIGCINAKTKDGTITTFDVFYGNACLPFINGKMMHLKDDQYQTILRNFLKSEEGKTYIVPKMSEIQEISRIIFENDKKGLYIETSTSDDNQDEEKTKENGELVDEKIDDQNTDEIIEDKSIEDVISNSDVDHNQELENEESVSSEDTKQKDDILQAPATDEEDLKSPEETNVAIEKELTKETNDITESEESNNTSQDDIDDKNVTSKEVENDEILEDEAPIDINEWETNPEQIDENEKVEEIIDKEPIEANQNEQVVESNEDDVVEKISTDENPEKLEDDYIETLLNKSIDELTDEEIDILNSLDNDNSGIEDTQELSVSEVLDASNHSPNDNKIALTMDIESFESLKKLAKGYEDRGYDSIDDIELIKELLTKLAKNNEETTQRIRHLVETESARTLICAKTPDEVYEAESLLMIRGEMESILNTCKRAQTFSIVSCLICAATLFLVFYLNFGM